MTPKETGSFDDDWSEISGGHREEESGEQGADDESDEVPPWAEALARADPESHPTGVERMDAEERTEANAAGADGSENKSEELNAEEREDGEVVAGNTIAIITAPEADVVPVDSISAFADDEDTSGLAGARATEKTAIGEATGRANDADGNEASLAPAAGVPLTDSTDDGIDVDADVVPPVDAMSVGNGEAPHTAVATAKGDEKGEEKGDENTADEGTGAFAPKADAAPHPDVTKTMWFWRTDDGSSWEPYGDADAARLELAHSSGEETVFLSDDSLGVPKYECHLGRRMRQRNLRTNRARGMCRGWPADPQKPSVFEPSVESAAGGNVSVEDNSVGGREDEINPDADAAPGTVGSANSEASGTEDRDEAEETHWTKLSVDEFDVPPLTDWTRAMIFAGNDHETAGESAGLGVNESAEDEGEGGPEEATTKDDAAAARVVENLAAFVGHRDTVVDAVAGTVPKDKYGLSTPMFGGGGGGPFDDPARPYVRIAEIAVNAGAIIDGIGVTYSDGTATKHGGEGGGWHSFPMVGGEGVAEVHVRYGRFVRGLEFRTNTGRTFGPLGEGGFVLGLGRVGEATIKAPEGHILAGIHGREGKYIDGIGFHWAPAVL